VEPKEAVEAKEAEEVDEVRPSLKDRQCLDGWRAWGGVFSGAVLEDGRSEAARLLQWRTRAVFPQ
jgi:hypothetical protein